MALADFLSNIGPAMQPPMPGPISGFGGGTFGMDGSQVTPPNGVTPNTPMAALLGTPRPDAPQSAPQPQARARRSGVKHFLGVLGDALLAGAGGEPIYGPSVEREEMGEALASYIGDIDAALADIMRRDPATGFALLKMKQDMAPEARNPTALEQNIELLRRLNPGMTDEQLAEVAQYAIAAPRMYGSPEMGWQPDPNYPFARPQTQPDASGFSEGQTATNLQTGEQIMFRNGAWVPAGGGGGDVTGGFPGP